MRVWPVSLLLLPFVANGGGFELPTTGQRAFGMAGAFCAVADDASAVYHNPGAMSLFEMTTYLTAGGVYSTSSTSFLSRYNESADALKTGLATFHFYAVAKPKEKLAVGVGVFSPFGYHFKWDDAWEGRYVCRESSLKTYAVEPAVSYRITEQLGIGAGVMYTFGKWENRRAVPAGNAQGELSMSGSGHSLGFVAGIHMDMDEDLKFGLTYRSPQTFDIGKGDYAYAALPASLADAYPATGTFSTSLDLPGKLSFGVSYRFTDDFLATVEAGYAFWSSLSSMEFGSDTDSSFDYVRDFALEDAVSGRVGAQYSFTEAFDLRGGFAYEITPFNSNHLLPEIPDANRILFTLGASFHVNEYFAVDLTAGMENYFERQGDDQSTLLKGTYKTIRYLGGLSVNLTF